MDEQADQILLRVRTELLPEGADREQTLRLLAQDAAETIDGSVVAEGIYADACDREQVESTYIGMGLAVPHARVQGLSRACVYMGFSQAGIPWPHEEAHLIALLVVPWENPELHLQLLSRLVRWRRCITEAETCALAESADKLLVSLDEAFLDML